MVAFFVKTGKKNKSKIMVYRCNYRYVFWKFFYVSVCITSKSGDYSTKLPNFRKGVELPPPSTMVP